MGPVVFVRLLLAFFTRRDSTAVLAGIRVPTTVIVGDADTITPVADAQAMAAAIRGANLVVIERAGHMSPTEQPEAVTRALVGWMQR
jgi:pimeloyl-ACP methyl ester carboxylesterase